MKRTLSNKQLPDSALMYVLEAMIPYTEANLKLSFKPNLFFNDLENIDRQKKYKRQTLHNAFHMAKKQGLIVFDQHNTPKLTAKGRKKLTPYKPRRLSKGTRLMIIFDIPEHERYKRRQLRILLKELQFEQVQKSVWTSHYDHKDYIKEAMKLYKLKEYVLVYESLELKV